MPLQRDAHCMGDKIPIEMHFLAQLPAAPTGKLRKGVMKTMAQQPAASNPRPATP